MTLVPGTVLGPYEVVAPIGAGGMGEVFKAHDAKLNRDVAIKVLPARMASDPDALARFEREARAVAALSHPNILAIFDLGHADGLQFAVMELLDGQTLRQALETGPLPAKRAMDYGRQIADGLGAAHARGIVHRDLKPENLFVTRDGHIKILDFGLARQVLTGSDSKDVRTERVTEPGMVMGTAGYMAPEQVRGGAVDHRTDIFGLGVVLYEMVAGRRAFERATTAETMTAVLRDDPAPLSSVRETVPTALERVIDHCLEKQPDDRFQSARDLSFALRSLLGASSGERAFSDGASTSRQVSRIFRVATASAVAMGGIALFLAGRYTTGRPEHGPAAPRVLSFEQVTDQPGVESTPSLSPDGKSVVYSKTDDAGDGLYVLRVGNRNPVRLAPASKGDDQSPAFSPDGERIAFRSSREGGGIFLMTASGESVTRLTDTGFSPSWSPDGTAIVVSPAAFKNPANISSFISGLSVVDVQSGRVRALPTREKAFQPAWSPHGSRIAYWGVRGESGQRDIWTVAADGSEAGRDGVPVTNDPALDWSPTWAPDGRSLYFSSTRGGILNLWRVAIDERSGRVLEDPEPVTAPTAWSGFLSFSRDGTRLAFASLDYRSTLFRVPFDAAKAVTGPAVPIVKGSRPIRDHELSPDGEWVAFTSAGPQEDLFVARVDGAEYRRLTDDPFRDRGPLWAPDGSRIAFYSDRSGIYDLWTIRPDGSALAPLTQGAGIAGFPIWAPDGKTIAFGFQTWHILSVGGRPASAYPPQPAISRTEQFQPMSWSSNGGRLAGIVVNGSTAVVTIYDFASKRFTPVPGELAHSSTWIMPIWLADGRHLIVRRSDGVALIDAGTGAGRLLIPVGGSIIGRSVGVSHDNKWITYSETATEGDVWIASLRN